MAKSIEYKTSGTCSLQINVTVEDDIITDVEFIRGCAGNTMGVAQLIKGMHVDEAIAKLEGIDCKGRGTSCPDQLTKALRELKKQ